MMNLFACPLCHEPLHRRGGALQCNSKHSFDIARQGYVNLLPPQHRRSRAPGDSAEMIAARTRFLDSGHYAPLREAVTTMIGEACRTLADLGCGEGYFTSAFNARADCVYGLDISKAAIQAASRRAKTLKLSVASTVRLPLLDGSFDAATIIMAPNSDDVARVVKAGGHLYRVTPGADHLQEFKALVYRDPRQHRRADTQLAGFTLTDSQRITGNTVLSGQSRADLLVMTPMQYRTARTAQARELAALPVTTDFVIDVFERRG